jgi:hypothetical protein
MEIEKRDRVEFHSKEDLASRHNLELAEKTLNAFDAEEDFDINDIIELYQIKLYFDNNLYLDTWNESDKRNYIEIKDESWIKIREFCLKINNGNIIAFFNEIEYSYYDSFWDLIEIFQIYKKLDKNILNEISKSSRFNISYVLRNRKTVEYFDIQIKKYLINNPSSTEIIVSGLEHKFAANTEVLHFPKSLSSDDKEAIIQNYLDKGLNANLNYVNLIIQSRDNELKLSPRTRLKAKKLAEELNNDIKNNGVTWDMRIQVTLSKDQIEPVKSSFENSTITYSYSEKWIDESKDYGSLFHVFSQLFKYIDVQGCITLVNKNREIDAFEKVFIRSKNEFLISEQFHQKSMLSQLQLLLYLGYLNHNNIKIEEILSFIVNEYLNKNYKIKGLTITFPSDKSSPLEKIRMLAPEFEFLLKQYKLYVEENDIDFELLQLNSFPLYLSDIKSKVANKYVYGKGNEFLKLRYVFFSRQSMLWYIEPFKDKYKNFYELIFNENVAINDFQDWQKLQIKNLISEEYLFINKNNFVKIKDTNLMYVIGKLHYEEVMSFWYYPTQIRDSICYLENKGILCFENTLFTKDEIKYFNFYLNKKEFSNGLDLRNKYLHGTNSNSIEEQKNDYNILLKLFVLIILKMEDDLLIEKRLNTIS